MMERNEGFWESIRQLTLTDSSVDVPRTTRQKALALFPSGASPRQRIFSLIPASLAPVRKGEGARKLSYESGDDVVQLELVDGANSCRLSGFVHGIDDGPVTVYGEECRFEARIADGAFLFDALPFGTYSLCFTREGVNYWLSGVETNPKTAP